MPTNRPTGYSDTSSRISLRLLMGPRNPSSNSSSDGKPVLNLEDDYQKLVGEPCTTDFLESSCSFTIRDALLPRIPCVRHTVRCKSGGNADRYRFEKYIAPTMKCLIAGRRGGGGQRARGTPTNRVTRLPSHREVQGNFVTRP